MKKAPHPPRSASLILIASLLVSHSGIAGPFGFEMGTSAADLQKQLQLQQKKPWMFQTSAAPQSHPDFQTYTLLVTPDHGLCKVSAVSRSINTSAYGTELVSEFDNLEKALVTKYGQSSKRFDQLLPGSIWRESRYWMMGLIKKERLLAAYWTNKEPAMPDNIASIKLEAHAYAADGGLISLTYEFSNVKACLPWIGSQENSAL